MNWFLVKIEMCIRYFSDSKMHSLSLSDFESEKISQA